MNNLLKVFVWMSVPVLTIILIVLVIQMTTNNIKNNDSCIYSIYIPSDIIHINDCTLVVSFEVADTSYTFDSKAELNNYIEVVTAHASSVFGYQQDLQYQINSGYIISRSVINEDESYTEMIYTGPNWTVDATKDTSFILATFDSLEKIYDPKTKSILYESYNMP